MTSQKINGGRFFRAKPNINGTQFLFYPPQSFCQLFIRKEFPIITTLYMIFKWQSGTAIKVPTVYYTVSLYYWVGFVVSVCSQDAICLTV